MWLENNTTWINDLLKKSHLAHKLLVFLQSFALYTICMKSFFKPDFPFSPKSWPFFYGWWVLFASSIGIIASIPGQTMGFSVFTDILISELELSRNALSFAYLFGTVGGGLLLPYVGTLFDRWGARVLATVGCMIFGIGMIWLSQIDWIVNTTKSAFTAWSWPQMSGWVFSFAIMTFGFFWLRFMGQGLLTMTSRSMAAKWFNYRRGLAISISGVVISFSFSIAPRVLDWFIQSFTWKGTWLILGLLIGVGMALFTWLFYRDNPEDSQLQMDGLKPVKPPKKENKDLIIKREYTRSEALRTLSFWVFNLSLGFQAFTITGYTFHVVAIGAEYGLTKDAVLSAFLPASLISVILSVSGGWLSSRIRLKYLLAVMNLGGVVFFTCTYFAGSQTMLIPIIAGLGMLGGFFGLISGIVWARFFGRKHLGAISGVNMATMVHASALGPIFFSLMDGHFSSFQVAFDSLLILSAAIFLLSFKADNPQRKLAA